MAEKTDKTKTSRARSRRRVPESERPSGDDTWPSSSGGAANPLTGDSPLLGGDRKNRGDLGKVEQQLNDLVGATSLLFVTRGDMYCGTLLAQRGPILVSSWIELAKVNDGVRRVLERMSSGGAYSGVIMSTLAIAIPMAQHHNLYPQHWPNPWTLDVTPLDLGMNGQSPTGDASGSVVTDEDVTNPSGNVKGGQTEEPGLGNVTDARARFPKK